MATNKLSSRNQGRFYLRYLIEIAWMRGLMLVWTRPVFDSALKPRPAYVAELKLVDLEDERTVVFSQKVTATHAFNLIPKRVASVGGQVQAAIQRLVNDLERGVAPELREFARHLALEEVSNWPKQLLEGCGWSLRSHSVMLLRKCAEMRGLRLVVMAPTQDEENPEHMVQTLAVRDDAGMMLDGATWPYFKSMGRKDRARRQSAIMQLLARVQDMPLAQADD